MEPTDDLDDDHATGPAASPPPPPDEPAGDAAQSTLDRRPAPALAKVSTALAWLALPLLVASAVLFLVPVESPGVQRCGSPAVFLLKATADKPLFDKDGKPVNGWSPKELRRAYDHRCSKVVARRAVPAGGLLVGFWVVALVAALLTWATRRSLRIRARQARRDAAHASADAERVG